MIKNYLFALLTFAMSNLALSQIVHTDINPDVVTTMSANPGYASNIYGINFDNAGIIEYNFRWNYFAANDYFMHLTFGNNCQIGLKGTATNTYGGRFVQPLAFGASINSTLLWGTSFPEPFIGESTTDTNFLGLGDRYIPVRFPIGGNNYYYGWILVNFENFGTTKRLTIKSYAYNTVLNQAILAGQTSALSTSEVGKEELVSIYPNPTNGIVNIVNEFKGASIREVTIVDQKGSVVRKVSSDFALIDLSSLETGVYYLIIESSDKDQSIKKVIKN